MKKRFFALLLVLALALPFPAIAAEADTGFTDVSPDDWFAPYVEACVEAGLMEGTGEGRFSPTKTLSGYECAILAMRLHNIVQGGDGSFEKAPWNWGYAFLALPDGAVMREGYLSDASSWDWRRFSATDDGHLGFLLDTEEKQTWGRGLDYQKVTLTLDGTDYAGELHLDGYNFLYFELADDGNNSKGYDAIRDTRWAPTPSAWWRDAWYYAKQNGLTNLLMEGNNHRWDFAHRMAAVTDLPVINDITGLPDTGDPDALELYRAGVLTGSDEYGTFNGYLTLTRAEAAAICARILRPELRISFSPKPLETYENYTLTYLREGGGRYGSGPYCPIHSMDLVAPDDHSLLRLDGVELAVPEGYEIQTIGDGVAGLVDWAHAGEGQSENQFGLLDSQGQFRACTRDEVFQMSRYPYDNSEFLNGYRLNQTAFFNEKGEQASQAFDWAGVINSEGAGFVGLDGKIYRIQFAASEEDT